MNRLSQAVKVRCNNDISDTHIPIDDYEEDEGIRMISDTIFEEDKNDAM